MENVDSKVIMDLVIETRRIALDRTLVEVMEAKKAIEEYEFYLKNQRDNIHEAIPTELADVAADNRSGIYHYLRNAENIIKEHYSKSSSFLYYADLLAGKED